MEIDQELIEIWGAIVARPARVLVPAATIAAGSVAMWLVVMAFAP